MPVAESGLSRKTAFSGSGWIAAGGTFSTARWSAGTSISRRKIPFRKAFASGNPHRNTKPVRKTHGNDAFHAPGADSSTSATAPAVPPGFQKRISTTSDSIATVAAMMSTSQGPWKLLTKNCMTPKLIPVTKQAGHTASIPRQPACAATSQKGTTSEKSGSCRPTIALSCIRSRPVMSASVVSGVPSEPKATGAVLPMRASFAASSGLKPRPIMSAPVIATGAPKPAAPSMKAPKLKAIRRAWMRRSPDTPATCRCSTPNCPVSTLRL